MTADRDYSLAATAYRAYGGSVNWRNYQGGVMPPWADLPAAIQDAWRAAAEAAARVVLREGT